MAAVAYLEQKARQLGEPLVICLGMGTNNGSHSGGSELEVYLNEIGALYRRCVVIASGNEANARHHFHGMSNVTLEPDGNTVGNALSSDPVEVEINVENDMPGFYLELWAAAPEVFALSVTSPSGGDGHRSLPEQCASDRIVIWKERVWRSITGQLEEREAISLCLFALTGRQGESGHCRCIRIDDYRRFQYLASNERDASVGGILSEAQSGHYADESVECTDSGHGWRISGVG